MRLLQWINGPDPVPPGIARLLLDELASQISTVIVAGIAFMVLGIIGFLNAGSVWYLGGAAVAGLCCAWRLQTIYVYRQARRRDIRPSAWVWRFLPASWCAAAAWGAWSLVLLYEPDMTIVVMVIGAQSACVIGAAVRNCAIRRMAHGQAFLTLLPLAVTCLLSGKPYLQIYCVFVVIHLYSALALTTYLNRQLTTQLLQNEEKNRLLAQLEQVNQELELANRHLGTLAATDPLTGIANRRAFDTALLSEWRRCSREQAELSLLLIDIDYFKAFNDFYGHPAGDGCLSAVAVAIRSVLRRPADLIARYGGEEFAVILPHTDAGGARVVAERLSARIAELRMVHEASPLGYVTVSIGAACIIPDRDVPLDRLAARADAALYSAKRAGRARVHVANSLEMLRTDAASA